MHITVNFESIDEMVEFSSIIIGNFRGKVESKTEAEKPATAPQPEQPVAYGQQIAAHFPAANTGQAASQPQATVQPTAPVQPQATVQPTAPVQPQAPAPQAPQPAPQPAPAPQATVPTTAPAYKLDDLSNAAMQLMDKGMQAQLLQLISQFGVESLPQLRPEQYGNFATALRGLGAQI